MNKFFKLFGLVLLGILLSFTTFNDKKQSSSTLVMGYMSNVENRNYLNSEQGRNETSKRILEFISEN